MITVSFVFISAPGTHRCSINVYGRKRGRKWKGKKKNMERRKEIKGGREGERKGGTMSPFLKYQF